MKISLPIKYWKTYMAKKKHTALNPDIRSTTVLGVIANGKGALGADGQVSFNNTVMKHSAQKVRRVGAKQDVVVGFAGATADAFTLLQRFEEKLESHRGNLARAAIDLAKDWRTDRYLRRLEAMLIVMDKDDAFIISGTGDVIRPDDNIVAIGSGGSFALSAARALSQNTDMEPAEIVQKSLEIAGDICIYTNKEIVIETVG